MLVPKKRSRKRPRNAASSESNRFQRPGRPMKQAEQLASPRKGTQNLARQLHSQRSSTAANMPTPSLRSSFERLPIEIIHHIFFDSLEVNLANTSRTLNRALSQRTIYRALVLFAYFDDDGVHPVETRYFRPATFRRLSLDDRLRLQVGILKCRWCTLDAIKACMPVLTRLTMVQAWHREQRFEQDTFSALLGDAVCAPKEIIRVPNIELLDTAPLPPIDNDPAMQQHFMATVSSAYYKSPYFDPPVAPVGPSSTGGFLPFIQCWDYSPLVQDNPDGLVHKIVGHATATLGVMVVPDALLEGGPWTDDKIEFLQLLRQGLRYKRHSEFIIIRAAAMMKGMQSAILESRPEVLRVLIELHERIASLYQDGPELDKNYERIFTSLSDPNPSLDALPPYLFHSASRQGAASSALLSLLIRASWRSIDPDDPVLTGWALRTEASGDRLGRWLKKYMEGTYGQDFRQRPVFINGALSWRLREADYPFPESSFTGEIGYIHEHAPDKPMRRWPG